MDLSKKLKEKGWHLTEDGIKKLLTDTKTEDVTKIIAAALNTDFREIAGGALPVKREEPILRGRIVLQVQKVRNIAAPKSNEESKVAPRFLQLDLSDGQTSVQALELEPVASLNLNVAPGTKIYFLADTMKLMHGFIILRPSELQVLGGRVEALYEKWDTARTLQKYVRSGRKLTGSNATAPPPWVAFGKKSGDGKDALANERSFKSLAALQDKDKESKENAEFNAMRSQAIALATKVGVKKIFGGGGQTIVDHNVKKILDKGYTEEDAKHALRTTNNNLERALYNLKRRSEKKDSYETGPTERGRHTGSKRFGGGGRDARDEGESKPAGNVSLFDFLTNKLPVVETPAPTTTSNTTTSNKPISSTTNQRTTRFEKQEPAANERSKFENNISSSFAANRSSGPRDSGNSYRGRGVGGGSERSARSGNKEPYMRSDGNETSKDQRRSTNPRKPARDTRELNPREEKRREDVRDGGRRSEAPRNEKSRNNFEQRRGNERQSGNYNQRLETAGNDSSRSSRPGTTNTSSNTASRHNEDYAKHVDKLIENTANLKIDSKSNDTRGSARKTKSYGGGQYQQPNQKAQSQVQQPQPLTTTTIQQQTASSNNNNSGVLNGYSYDPSKIIGFQSKETNEFALSLLKSQGVAVPHTSSAAASNQSHQAPQQPQQPLPPPANSGNTANFVPSATHYTPSNYMVPNTQTAMMQSAQQFGMGQSDCWLWKIGDLCLAKYWDDGQYYEAEITAISDKTCVVLFLGYGNHEEVLKSDCLPITDSNHIAINNRQQVTSMQNVGGGVYQPRGNTSGNSGGGGAGPGVQRCRGERQMYVPPHKR